MWRFYHLLSYLCCVCTLFKYKKFGGVHESNKNWSRGLNIEEYFLENVSEIVSGGARGVDMAARSYALSHGLKLTEFLPQYERYGRAAPIRRNVQIVDDADFVIAFWDGANRGTKFVIEYCNHISKKHQVYLF